MQQSSPGMEWRPIQGGVEILFVASWYWNEDIIGTGLMGHFTYIQTFSANQTSQKGKSHPSNLWVASQTSAYLQFL